MSAGCASIWSLLLVFAADLCNMDERDMKHLLMLLLSVFLADMAAAGSIYSTVDASGKRVFSDEPSAASSEVTLSEATVFSGKALGKSVKYKYGKPDSAQGAWKGNTHPQLRKIQRQDRVCTKMKEVMNSSAGALKVNTESRYNRECILGQ